MLIEEILEALLAGAPVSDAISALIEGKKVVTPTLDVSWASAHGGPVRGAYDVPGEFSGGEPEHDPGWNNCPSISDIEGQGPEQYHGGEVGTRRDRSDHHWSPRKTVKTWKQHKARRQYRGAPSH